MVKPLARIRRRAVGAALAGRTRIVVALTRRKAELAVIAAFAVSVAENTVCVVPSRMVESLARMENPPAASAGTGLGKPTPSRARRNEEPGMYPAPTRGTASAVP